MRTLSPLLPNIISIETRFSSLQGVHLGWYLLISFDICGFAVDIRVWGFGLARASLCKSLAVWKRWVNASCVLTMLCRYVVYKCWPANVWLHECFFVVQIEKCILTLYILLYVNGWENHSPAPAKAPANWSNKLLQANFPNVGIPQHIHGACPSWFCNRCASSCVTRLPSGCCGFWLVVANQDLTLASLPWQLLTCCHSAEIMPPWHHHAQTPATIAMYGLAKPTGGTTIAYGEPTFHPPKNPAPSPGKTLTWIDSPPPNHSEILVIFTVINKSV